LVQGTLTGGENSVQFTSLYRLSLDQLFLIVQILFTMFQKATLTRSPVLNLTVSVPWFYHGSVSLGREALL